MQVRSVTWARTSASGASPAFVRAANSSYWLPPSQFATFLPRIFAIVLIPELFQVSWVMPERAKTWAMLMPSMSGFGSGRLGLKYG